MKTFTVFPDVKIFTNTRYERLQKNLIQSMNFISLILKIYCNRMRILTYSSVPYSYPTVPNRTRPYSTVPNRNLPYQT